MKILLSNKYYYRRGGDCIYTINLEHLLKRQGHDVAIFAMQYPENIKSPWSKYFPSEVKFSPGIGMIEAFRRPFGTDEVKKKFSALIRAFKPDVVHLNNVHSQLSPLMAEIAHEQGIKVVWTLHDYKLLCPRYDCLRNGEQLCEECFTDKHKVLDYRCMKNSKLASMLSYWEAKNWNRERLENCVDAFICPSQFLACKMMQGGFSVNKIEILCNSIDIEKTKKDNYCKGNYYCFVGRLSHEKGVAALVEAARKFPYKLKIIGGGPLEYELKSQNSQSNIEFVGYKQWEELKDIVGKARFSVIPSEWYENNPLSVIEAQCLGTPVLGAKIGGIPELINEHSGMTFKSRNVEDLSAKIELMWNAIFDYEKLALESQNKYSEESYYEKIMKIYK